MGCIGMHGKNGQLFWIYQKSWRISEVNERVCAGPNGKKDTL
jgi:hypothetical protein